MTDNNPNLDLVINNAYTKLVKFLTFVLKLLNGNENVTSIKCHNSNLQKMTSNNINLDLVNIIFAKNDG